MGRDDRVNPLEPSAEDSHLVNAHGRPHGQLSPERLL